MVSFLDRILSSNENLVEEVRTHWWEMVGSTLGLLAAVVVVLFFELTGLLSGGLGFLIGSILLVAAVGYWVLRYVRWRSRYLLLTDRRVVVVTGVLRHTTNEIPINRITDIRCEQGILGRILNFGSIIIQSAGTDGSDGIGHVEGPFELRNKINALSELNIGSDKEQATRPDRAATEVVDALERLARLLQAGLVSQEDYERMKSRLIG